jgi:hypothetical protein
LRLCIYEGVLELFARRGSSVGVLLAGLVQTASLFPVSHTDHAASVRASLMDVCHTALSISAHHSPCLPAGIAPPVQASRALSSGSRRCGPTTFCGPRGWRRLLQRRLRRHQPALQRACLLRRGRSEFSAAVVPVVAAAAPQLQPLLLVARPGQPRCCRRRSVLACRRCGQGQGR